MVNIYEKLISMLPQVASKSAGKGLTQLVECGLDQIPLPGSGATLLRWQILAAIGGQDLSLVKLYEGHTDALAIFAELHMPPPAHGTLWGVWCAETKGNKLNLTASEDGKITLTGIKSWCSGASSVTHALVSCWNKQGEVCLAAVELGQPNVQITDQGWHAVGMAGSASVDVIFNGAICNLIGAPHAYLERPGFWHGGAGIAACWYGAACSLAMRLHAQMQPPALITTIASSKDLVPDPYRLAHLGNIELALHSAKTILKELATVIDHDPQQDVMAYVLRARLTVEAAATQVLTYSTRALGATPLCRETAFAQIAADLPVFLRQSHAERDLASLGSYTAHHMPAWIL